ncbi:MAG: hypothetical protein FWB74_00670 [Defluviitaleaceae bacterium]|nr:hypothetical protein [Defluviitaleaceae bacterium]
MALEKNGYNVAPDPRLDIPEGQKVDLFAFLESQPDANFELGDFTEEVAEPEPELLEEAKKVNALAERIRVCSKNAQIISFSVLFEEDEGVVGVFENLYKDESYNDILNIKGVKDTYYYSITTMSSQFAQVAVNVVEGDDARTMAHSIRVRSKYPALTDAPFFKGYPCFFSDEQIAQVREVFKVDENYKDIKEVEFLKTLFFYSADILPYPEQAHLYAQQAMGNKYGLVDTDGNRYSF